MNFLYLDTEYSSFYSSDKSKSGDLLQLAIIPVVNGVMKPAFNEYCKPLGKVWNVHAEKVHKITRAFANRQQHPNEMAVKLVAFLQQYDMKFTCAGWNCRGDKSYIERLVNNANLTAEWHQRINFNWRDVKDRLKDRKKNFPVKDLKLPTAAKYFNIKTNSHDALADADATKQVDDRCETVQMIDVAVQIENSQLTELQKKDKYVDRKYLQMGNGSVFISEHATKNPEAMKVIIEELWNVYVEGR